MKQSTRAAYKTLAGCCVGVWLLIASLVAMILATAAWLVRD
ncbi:hypothetical protein OIE62_33285 [Streptomyces scopuliridis]|uniref:Uncharacterized protein n=1 Tax=Streptomyces scopuliridis TaxID=452529 RepID=A0ACD4ZFC7_9ACTN|nr:hypothetical protein [Streptomyces scopuliridis]WSB38979.1 hypothetical protein OG949_07050 [Streptomyces scopuliridis]WSB96885.1 hypothetical protein OG835_07650 [Streptomyces scopuliridis]WSC09411.1 hypothetical protein OIE62_33285 [Streptomyces scopuliridis]